MRRKQSWVWIPVRVLLLTLILALLSFAISLFLTIAGLALWEWGKRGTVDMAMAYRKVALPVAMMAAAVALVSVSVFEIRQYRRL